MKSIEEGCLALIIPPAHNTDVGKTVRVLRKMTEEEVRQQWLYQKDEWWHIDKALLFNDNTHEFFACTKALMRIDGEFGEMKEEDSLYEKV